MEKLKEISFRVTDEEFNKIVEKSKKVGLKPSHFAKSSTIKALNSEFKE